MRSVAAQRSWASTLGECIDGRVSDSDDSARSGDGSRSRRGKEINRATDATADDREADSSDSDGVLDSDRVWSRARGSARAAVERAGAFFDRQSDDEDFDQAESER
jgi:hypothetical protein